MKLDYLNTTVVLAAQLLNFQEANYLFIFLLQLLSDSLLDLTQPFPSHL